MNSNERISETFTGHTTEQEDMQAACSLYNQRRANDLNQLKQRLIDVHSLACSIDEAIDECIEKSLLVDSHVKRQRSIHIPPLTAKPEQLRLTMRSGVLTSISSRQYSAISSRPLPERTDFGPVVYN